MNPSQKLDHKTKGQISIMIALMMSTFVFFFAFVINTGMLVNAKINLQNAADLAAYAGAAVQARQLTQIAYLNYEMRRQYKKFLFRIYVLGNMAQKSFPRTSSGTGSNPMRYLPDLSQDYQKPTTCVIFNQKDNYCQLSVLPPIAIPPHNFLDVVTEVLRGQLQSIEVIRQNNCKAIGMTNILLNALWLYNSDPTLTEISGLNASQSNTVGILRSLATGLGIVPRELILRQRIKTLNQYVNAPAQRHLSLAGLKTLENAADVVPNERAIQAFKSAYYTLGNHTFSGDQIFMDELTPASLLELKDISRTFTIWAIDLDPGNIDPNEARKCVAQRTPATITQPLPLGVYKDPTILTYYAIRLSATARLLFSPFGDMQMKAYAAARPFGSRIGPDLSGDDFGADDNIPNLPVRENDSASRGAGWDTEQVVGSFYQILQTAGNPGVDLINSAMIEEAYQVAMAPNPYEIAKYTIMSDQGDDYFVKNFGLNPRNPTGVRVGAFWAPLFPPDQVTQSGNFESLINGFFDTGIKGVGASFQAAFAASLTQYVSSALKTENGENGESINIVKITNPFSRLDGSPLPPNPLITSDAQSIKTSWNTMNDDSFGKNGRNGYSVKLISFDSLTQHKLTTDGHHSWTNSLSMDPETKQDILFLQH